MKRPNTELSKKAKLLGVPDVKRWYDNLARKSRNTAEVAVRRLSIFCELNKTTPMALLQLPKKEIVNMLLDNVTNLEKQDYAGSYIMGITKAVKSWLKQNEIKFEQSINVKDPKGTPTLANERVPIPSEVDAILANGDWRAKTECSLIAYSGVRLESLGNDNATDGIVLNDLPDLDLAKLEFTVIPARIVVRKSISKAGHQYFSFMNERACKFIIEYLKYRKSLGEKLSKQSPLIRATGRKLVSKYVPEDKRDSPFVCTSTVSGELRNIIRKAGYSWRPYVLRAYFDSQLLIAESNGKIAGRFTSFFMGHVGDIEDTYTTKKQLTEDMLSEMREAYHRASEFLIQSKADIQLKKMEDSQAQLTSDMIAKVNEATKEITKQLLVAIGWTSASDYDQFRNDLREELGREPTPQEIIDYAKDENEKNSMINELVKQKQQAAGIG